MANTAANGGKLTFALMLATAILSGGLTYGIMTARVAALEAKVEVIEKRQIEVMLKLATREEADKRMEREHADLDSKLDTLLDMLAKKDKIVH